MGHNIIGIQVCMSCCLCLTVSDCVFKPLKCTGCGIGLTFHYISAIRCTKHVTFSVRVTKNIHGFSGCNSGSSTTGKTDSFINTSASETRNLLVSGTHNKWSSYCKTCFVSNFRCNLTDFFSGLCKWCQLIHVNAKCITKLRAVLEIFSV